MCIKAKVNFDNLTKPTIRKLCMIGAVLLIVFYDLVDIEKRSYVMPRGKAAYLLFYCTLSIIAAY